jgi:uncharacterized membrane protein YeaQ/YmgE (transglycosylase-associated protein family)
MALPHESSPKEYAQLPRPDRSKHEPFVFAGVCFRAQFSLKTSFAADRNAAPARWRGDLVAKTWEGRSAVIIEILVVPLVCGIIAGWLGGLVTRGSGFGPIGNMIAAIVAAVLSAWLIRATGLVLIGSIADAIVASVAGAFLTLAIIGEMRR